LRGALILEDGRRFGGELHGSASGAVPVSDDAPGIGEVVFQTGMTGYQEVITDPSYRGQIVTFTSTHIGNTGVNRFDEEAAAPALAGVVVRSLSGRPSSWRSHETLPGYLDRHGIPCLSEVDTRALTRHIRERGALRGVIVADGVPVSAATERARAFPGLTGRDLVREVIPESSDDDFRASPFLVPFEESGFASRDEYEFARTAEELAESFPARRDTRLSLGGSRVTVVHTGMKEGIDACLRRRGALVRVVRPDVSAKELLWGDPDGVLLSNGPGDPDSQEQLIATVREVLGRAPLMGICLGFQVLALALGGRTRKMKHGHHGLNHPVKDLESGRVLVTSQNHGFEVVRSSLPEGVIPTYLSLNDDTLEGFRYPAQAVRAVQFHPEARGGPHDAAYLLYSPFAEDSCHAPV